MSERENFNKVIRLLSGGGTLVLRHLLEKYSAPLSFSEYVYQNQAVSKLKFFENQRKLVVAREIDKMDITLLGKLLTGLFKDKMTRTEIDLVKNIKDERNNLMHSEVLNEAKLDENVFNQRWRTISSILLDIATEIGSPASKTDIETLINEIKTTPSNYSEVHEILIRWCESNERLEERVMKGEHSTLPPKQYGPLDSLKAKFVANYEYNTTIGAGFTKSMIKAKDYVLNDYSVYLYGNPGEGKTMTAFSIVKDLVVNNVISLDRCVLLRKPEDLDIVDPGEIDLIIIDNMFGKYNPDNSDLPSWDFEYLESLVGKKKTRLIMCSRMHIYMEYRKKLDGLDIFSRTIELSSATLSHEERRTILIEQLEFHKRNVNDVNIEECITQDLVGFPLCAQQFARDDLLFAKKADHFRKPYRYFLEQNIQVLDDTSRIALLFVFYKQNKLKNTDLDITNEETKNLLVHIAGLCGVEKSIKVIVKETKDKITNMKNSYVKCIDDEVSYYHDTIYETVAKLHFKQYPSEVLKYCTIEYFFQCIEGQDQDPEAGIILSKAQYTALVNRVRKEGMKRLIDNLTEIADLLNDWEEYLPSSCSRLDL